jgi:hypothetical protein
MAQSAIFSILHILPVAQRTIHRFARLVFRPEMTMSFQDSRFGIISPHPGLTVGKMCKESLLRKRPARPAKPGDTISNEGVAPLHCIPASMFKYCLES